MPYLFAFSYCSWGSQGKNAELVCHAPLQWIMFCQCEMPGWRKYQLESRLPGEISVTSDMQMTPPFWKKVKKNLMKVKESEKVGLKLSIQKMKIMASSPITS